MSKPMEDAPLYLGIARAPTSPAFEHTFVVAEVAVIEETCLLRDLRPLPASTLAIRIADLRGRPTPIRLADLRGDDSHAVAA